MSKFGTEIVRHLYVINHVGLYMLKMFNHSGLREVAEGGSEESTSCLSDTAGQRTSDPSKDRFVVPLFDDFRLKSEECLLSLAIKK
jgi:hypothetical protein